MNIALLIETLAGGGSEGVVCRLAGGLARRGQRVFAYCLKTAGRNVEPLRQAGVVVREARSFGRDPLLAGRLLRWFHADRIEIVHAHSCAALVWALAPAKLLGLPVVHVRHGWSLDGPDRYARLADALEGLVDAVVLVCESGRTKLPRAVRRRAIHIPNGLDAAPVDRVGARERLEALTGGRLCGPVVLNVANIRPEKDTRGLLRAFELLSRARPDAVLVCAGAVRDAAYWAAVQSDLRHMGSHKQIHFAGHCEDAAGLMPGADVLCLASRSEALPNVILEAMAGRVPIVATAVGDVGRPGGPDAADTHASPPVADHFLLRHNDTALLVPPGDPPALAAALRCALDDPQAAGRRAEQAAAEHARRFTVERMLHGYEQLYADCLHGARRSKACCAGVRPERSRPVARRRVLMLGPAAPQVGGMVTAIDGLMTGALRRRCALYRLATPAPRERPRSVGWFGRVRRWARAMGAAARHVRALASLMRSLVVDRIELVHIHTCSFATFYRNLLDLVLVKLLGGRTLLHIRGGQFDRFIENSGGLARRVIRWGCGQADAVVVLSPGWQARLTPLLGRARLVAIPNGVPIPPARRRRNSVSACRFLFLGPLTAAKGLGDLLAAAERLRSQSVPFELIVAGPASGEQRVTWRQRIDEAGLTGAVTLRGPVLGTGKAELFAAADCLVHPSHSEGLPFTVLEAAAAGLAVIATAVGAVPEFMAAPLVPPRDPVALAGAMAELAENPGLREELGARLRAHVAAHYSLEGQARRLAELYDAILAPSPRRLANPLPIAPPAAPYGAPEPAGAQLIWSPRRLVVQEAADACP